MDRHTAPADIVAVAVVGVGVGAQVAGYMTYLLVVHHLEDAIAQEEPAPIVVDDIVHDAAYSIAAKEVVVDSNPDNNVVVHHSVDTYHSRDCNVAAVPVHIASGQYTHHSD